MGIFISFSSYNGMKGEDKMIRISEFQMKDVVNVSDGKRLGNISDIDIDINTGKIQAVIISKSGKMLGFLRKEEEVVVLWKNIVKIGEDVILVRVQNSPQPTDLGQTTTIS
ncbi:YlmC/YmxH family sporulation protein [Microbacteriaceae bacterium 4G12]